MTKMFDDGHKSKWSNESYKITGIWQVSWYNCFNSTARAKGLLRNELLKAVWLIMIKVSCSAALRNKSLAVFLRNELLETVEFIIIIFVQFLYTKASSSGWKLCMRIMTTLSDASGTIPSIVVWCLDRKHRFRFMMLCTFYLKNKISHINIMFAKITESEM